MGYFRERARPALAGFLLGVVVGWCQPYLLGVSPPPLQTRLFLILQMGLAFTMVALFVANYLGVRRRVIARYGQQNESNPAP